MVDMIQPDFGLADDYIEMRDVDGYPIEFMPYDCRVILDRKGKATKKLRLTMAPIKQELQSMRSIKKRKKFEFFLKLAVIGWLLFLVWEGIWRVL